MSSKEIHVTITRKDGSELKAVSGQLEILTRNKKIRI